ncbi:MAG: bifunctional folylpolyglutamate synthase/dihydrofolate synthase [Gracilibacteraceae bacterium]|jgi:dihydrofolate synthase/folylpolyglutamate synthase|nr:bifunctional folylpolyglutamate synthase/dihydrofolate synthase [Gracilibacteraceae bacterium]
MIKPLPAQEAYAEALRFIRSLTAFGVNLGLGRMEALLARLGRPERGLPVIHIGGTNGKGSVLALLQSILVQAGHTVGAFTSPHLEDYRERITVNGAMISPGDTVAGIEKMKPLLAELLKDGGEHPTEFEVSTALALDYFASRRPDYVLLEVGLGGAIDSTNVVTPLISVLTSISFDHPDYLGDTLEKIAKVKAGIIKPGVPVISAPQPPAVMRILRQTAAELDCRLIEVGRDVKWTQAGRRPGDSMDYYSPGRIHAGLEIGLRGEHQRLNAAVALTAAEWLRQERGARVTPGAVRRGLAAAEWPGRQELIFCGGRRFLLDGAHNEAAMRTLAAALTEYAGAAYRRDRLILCLGVLADKEIAKIAALIVPLADRVIVTRPDSPRAAFAETAALAAACAGAERVEAIENPSAALAACRREAGVNDLICVTGSFYLVGAARSYLTGRAAGGEKEEDS